jgi:hypothetical protein
VAQAVREYVVFVIVDADRPASACYAAVVVLAAFTALSVPALGDF